jgi:AcrR family transcriptional regulator
VNDEAAQPGAGEDGTRGGRARVKKRAGSATSRTRMVILRSAERIMIEHGYAAVTYRAVAAGAGVTAGLVQYYFPVLDDLFTALLRDDTDRVIGHLTRATQDGRPLRAVWDYASSAAGTTLMLEFMALANHRKAIGPVMGEGGERVRQAQVAAITAAAGRYELPPAALAFLLTAIPRMAGLEEAFGTTTGHQEAISLIQRYLDQVEPLLPAAGPGPGRARRAIGQTGVQGAAARTAAGTALTARGTDGITAPGWHRDVEDPVRAAGRGRAAHGPRRLRRGDVPGAGCPRRGDARARAVLLPHP